MRLLLVLLILLFLVVAAIRFNNSGMSGQFRSCVESRQIDDARLESCLALLDNPRIHGQTRDVVLASTILVASALGRGDVVVEMADRLTDMEKLPDGFSRAEALRVQALVLYERGDLPDLLKILEELDELDQMTFGYKMIRADALSRMGQIEMARIDYTALLAERPEDIPARIGLAQTWLLQDNMEPALAELDTVVSYAPDDASLVYLRAMARNRAQDFDGALADLNRSLDLDPSHAPARVLRAFLSFKTIRFDGAARDFDIVIGAGVLDVEAQPLGAVMSYIAHARIGSERLILTADIDRSIWPGPVVAYMLGEIDRDELLATAAMDTEHARANLCEAHFYIAEKALIDGKEDLARDHFNAVIATDVTGYIEYQTARIELNAMDGDRP